jgi:hypothetical protein
MTSGLADTHMGWSANAKLAPALVTLLDCAEPYPCQMRDFCEW